MEIEPSKLDAVYVPVNLLSELAPVCPICMQPGCTVALKSCGHIYCNLCITSWLPNNGTCPVCREPAEKMDDILHLPHLLQAKDAWANSGTHLSALPSLTGSRDIMVA